MSKLNQNNDSINDLSYSVNINFQSNILSGYVYLIWKLAFMIRIQGGNNY